MVTQNSDSKASSTGGPSLPTHGWFRHVLAGSLLSVLLLLALSYHYRKTYDGFTSAQADFVSDLYAGSLLNSDADESLGFGFGFGGGGGGEEDTFSDLEAYSAYSNGAPSTQKASASSSARKKYRQKVLQYHPDKDQGSLSEQYHLASMVQIGTQGTPTDIAQTGDSFQSQPENPYKRTKEEPVSTFSVDVDTSSYSFTRRILNNRQFPDPDIVKIEEMMNYFDYEYPTPQEKETPFQSTVMVSDSPWNQGRKLMHIGIKGYDIDKDSIERPFSNIVLLVDVSGSMESVDRLPLAKESIEMLLDSMMPEDYVSIVTYASEAKVVLEPTLVAKKKDIVRKLKSLRAGGGTWGTGGIEMAYKVAEENFDADAVNRIILVTDGDFNIGLMGAEELEKYIEQKRETGVFLSVLGFGMGNYRDTNMKALANHGNGVAAYIDSIEEAHKVMVTESQSTMFPIAKDVKIQIEFNPAVVAEYRLVGYEKRMLERQDFNNDKVDAGDIGAGHTVTAIYEFTPTGSEDAAALDELRYGTAAAENRQLVEEEDESSATGGVGADGQEYAFLKMRYKLPDEDTSRLISMPITRENDVENMMEQGSNVATTVRQEFQFATAVAGFAQLLKGSKNIGETSYEAVLALAEENKGADSFGYRREFVRLVRTAKHLVQESKENVY